MKAATGLAQGRRPDPALAARAVETAMTRAGLTRADAVLLYLTADFARDPQPALTAAARAASCLQIAGCAAAGVLTEEDWVLDAPAAAALVLGEGVTLRAADALAPTLTFAAPNALDLHWLQGGGARFGGVAGDASGQGPYCVWSHGRVAESGRCEMALAGANLRIGVSQGVRPLCAPAEVRRACGQEVFEVGGDSALAGLVRELPLGMRAPGRIPTHLLMAGLPYGAPERALEEGRFHLLPVLEVNAEARSVLLAGEVPLGVDLFWAQRQPQAAEQDMRALIRRLAADAAGAPEFALLFPCMGRGPGFYSGQDRDLKALTKALPGLPCIGFYGNGEIAHLDGANRLLQYSVVLGLGVG
ncbi:MAG: FIST C-terminal domain-containing protein [Betaproteobacteria bacterium]|nr:FIST C-terminal domain-containing protein [Betaproteobacteria bacterium]